MTPQPAGYSGTPLVRKLGVKEGEIVALADAPRGFESLLEPLPSGARTRRTATGACGVLLVFLHSFADLERALAAHAKRSDVRLLWLAWPKQTSKLAGPLNETHVREAALAAGLVDSKVCAIDDDWSALRFTRRR